MRFTLSLNRSSTGLHRSRLAASLELLPTLRIGHLHQLAKAYGKTVKISLV